MPKPLSPAEVAALGHDLLRAKELRCPRCGLPLDRRSIPPRADVSYVRHRVWVGCPACRLHAVLDRSERR